MDMCLWDIGVGVMWDQNLHHIELWILVCASDHPPDLCAVSGSLLVVLKGLSSSGNGLCQQGGLLRLFLKGSVVSDLLRRWRLDRIQPGVRPGFRHNPPPPTPTHTPPLLINRTGLRCNIIVIYNPAYAQLFVNKNLTPTPPHPTSLEMDVLWPSCWLFPRQLD